MNAKNKFYLLLFGLLVFFYMAYKQSFSKSIAAIKSYNSAQLSFEQMKAHANELDSLKVRAEMLDALIGKEGVSVSEVQQQLLRFVSSYKSCEIVEMKAPFNHQDDSFTIFTNTLIVKGNYDAIAKLVYDIEKKFKIAKLVSIHYYTKKNYRTKKTALFAALIFQNYEKK